MTAAKGEKPNTDQAEKKAAKKTAAKAEGGEQVSPAPSNVPLNAANLTSDDDDQEAQR